MVTSLFKDEAVVVRESSLKCVVPMYKQLSPEDIKLAFEMLYEE